MGLFDYVLIAVIGMCLFLAAGYIIRRKKKNKCSGCSGCSGCPGLNKCNKK